jgi:hypothetical protein
MYLMKKINRSTLAALLFVVVLTVALSAGCGGSKTATTGTTPLPSTKIPSSATSPATTHSDGSAPATSSNSLPRYTPSSVVSDTTGSLQLTSPDSVQKVTAFYDDALAKGGWSIISSSKTGASTNITARKSGTGTTLSVSSTGAGTYISLVTYPM